MSTPITYTRESKGVDLDALTAQLASARAEELATLKRWLKLLDQGHDMHVADEIRAIVRAAS